MKGFAVGPTCRRCNESVDETDDYCPTCGALLIIRPPSRPKRQVREGE